MSIFNGIIAPVVSLQLSKGGVWTNVEMGDVLSIRMLRGRRAAGLPVEAGTLTVTLTNRSGIYDPDYTLPSQWVVSGQSILRPGLPCRLVATWDGTTYDLFYGYMETPKINQGINPAVTLSFADGLAVIGRTMAPVLSDTEFDAIAGETVSTRVGRMLDLAGWAAGARAVSGYTAPLLGDVQDRSCLDIIRTCAASIGGKFYMSRSNIATLESISAKFSKVTRLAFADTAAVNTVKYATITSLAGADGVINDATITRSPSKTYRASTASSVSAYGTKSINVLAPVQDDATAYNLSLLYGRMWADPVTRISEVSFNGLYLGALYPDMLATELGDFCTIGRNTIDGRYVGYQLVVEGIDYVFTASGISCKFYTSPVNPYTITI